MKFSWLLIAFSFLFVGHVSHATVTQVTLSWASSFDANSIVIRAKERALYLILDARTALRYPVAVPKVGKEWQGATHIAAKQWNPAWAPPEDVRRDHPELPDQIAGGAANNPMGVAAISLEKSEIAIHGTANFMRKSIGTAASYGCIRMLNEDVTDLYQRVNVGTPVYMIPN